MKIKNFWQNKDEVKIKNLQDQVIELQKRNDEEEDEIRDFLKYEKSFEQSEDNSFFGGLNIVDETYNKGSLQKLYTSETWFYIAVSTVAEAIASLPFKIEKKKISKEQIEGPNGSEVILTENWIDASAEPEAEIFEYPNEIQTRFEFWHNVVADLLTTGDAFIYPHKSNLTPVNAREERLRNAISRIRRTDVDALFRINSSAVEVVPSYTEGQFIEGYLVSSGAKIIGLEPDQVINIKLPNPADPYNGLAPIVPVMKKVLLDRYTDEHHIRFYKQGARLGGVIETSKNLTKEQMNRLTSTFESRFTGKRQHHKTLILPNGMKYNPIEVSPIDSALIEFGKTNKEPILSAYKVPPIKVGLLDGASFANANIQNKTFYLNAVMPITTVIEQAINRSETILKANRNLRFKFDFSQVETLQEDFLSKAQSAQTMLVSGLSVNEVREIVWKKGPIDGGEVINAIRPTYPSPTMLAAQRGKEKVDAANVQNDSALIASSIIPTEVTFEQRVGQLIGEAVAQGVDIALATPRAIQQAQEEGFVPTPLENNKTISEVDNGSLEKTTFPQEKLLKFANALTGEGAKTMIEERQKEAELFFERMKDFTINNLKKKAFRKSLGFGLKMSLPSEADFKIFINKEIPNAEQASKKAVEHGYKNSLPSQSITFPNDDADAVLKKVATRNVTSITESSLGQLKNIITSSFSEQASPTELKSRIEDAFKQISAGKALTIARTETLTAVSIGQDLKTRSFKTANPSRAKDLKRVWITAEDEKVRPTHVINNGVVVQAGKAFPNGLRYPRDYMGSASEVINCRCSFVDYLPEDSESILDIFGFNS